jgi:hypothetical protein
MKSKYTQIVSDGIISNSRLEEITQTYDVVNIYNDNGKVVLILKKKSFIARLFNKIFNF